MAYRLGVDLGTTFVAAAIAYGSKVEMVTLGDRSVVTPSVVYLREDGVFVTGEAATRRAPNSPDRVAREFKRRLGDPTPVVLAGKSHAATDLLGAVLRDVLAKVARTEGSLPERVVLSHPANWGPYRRGLFEEVPRLGGIPDALTITEPEAAAAHYVAARKLNTGDTVAVYDLGGGTFDVTVLRKQPDGVEILGTPEGIERLGGIDFDEAVLNHINFASDGALVELDIRDPQNAVALARLRQDCVLAKESLSVDTETVIPVFLPGRNFDVRITRADFEKLIRAQIESTIGALSRTLRSARVSPAELSAVLLVGGSSRIPLVAEMVSQELGRPIVVDTHPKYAVALGAATVAAQSTRLAGGPRTGALAAASASAPPSPRPAVVTAPPTPPATSPPVVLPTLPPALRQSKPPRPSLDRGHKRPGPPLGDDDQPSAPRGYEPPNVPPSAAIAPPSGVPDAARPGADARMAAPGRQTHPGWSSPPTNPRQPPPPPGSHLAYRAPRGSEGSMWRTVLGVLALLVICVLAGYLAFTAVRLVRTSLGGAGEPEYAHVGTASAVVFTVRKPLITDG